MAAIFFSSLSCQYGTFSPSAFVFSFWDGPFFFFPLFKRFSWISNFVVFHSFTFGKKILPFPVLAVRFFSSPLGSRSIFTPPRPFEGDPPGKCRPPQITSSDFSHLSFPTESRAATEVKSKPRSILLTLAGRDASFSLFLFLAL